MDTVRKSFEKILLARILIEVSDRGLMLDEQFGFRPKHSTYLPQGRLTERITGNFGEKWLTGAVFLDVAKAFNTVRIDGLHYKLTILNLPSCLVKINSSYLQGRRFEAFFQTATSTHRGMRAGVVQGGLTTPVFFNLYVNDMSTPSHHVQLALYADDTVVIVISRKPMLLVSYLQTYLNDLQRWLSDLRIAINVSKSTTIIFARARRRFIEPRPVRFGKPIKWVDITRCLGVTLDTRLALSPDIDEARKKTAQRMGMLGPLLTREVIYQERSSAA